VTPACADIVAVRACTRSDAVVGYERSARSAGYCSVGARLEDVDEEVMMHEDKRGREIKLRQAAAASSTRYIADASFLEHSETAGVVYEVELSKLHGAMLRQGKHTLTVVKLCQTCRTF
jgi:hypothetical protein